MRTILRQGTLTGHSLVKRGGAIQRMKTKMTMCGNGMTKEFIDSRDVKHPYQIMRKEPKSSLETIKIKTSKPRKYISLNI